MRVVEEALGKGKRKADPSGLSLDDGGKEKRRQPRRTPTNVPTPLSVHRLGPDTHLAGPGDGAELGVRGRRASLLSHTGLDGRFIPGRAG